MKRILTVLVLVAATAFAVSALAKEAAPQKPTTVKGEIIDMGCFVSHGAMGADHKECATKCISSGMPMGLLTAAGKVYLLTPNHKSADAYNQCKDLAASTVEVTGVAYTKSGTTILDVTAVKAAN